MHLVSLCRNKCQFLDFIQIFQRIFQESEKVEFHEKCLLIIFWRRRVRKSMVAHFVIVIIYLLGLCRNNANCWILYKFFRKFSKRVNRTSWRTFTNNFWRRQVRKSIIDLFVAVIMHLVSLCRNKCQFLDFIQIFQRIFQESEEKVELHEKCLLITFWRRQVRKSIIAHFAAVIMYLLNLCRNNANCRILCKYFRQLSKRVKKKSNFMKNVC